MPMRRALSAISPSFDRRLRSVPVLVEALPALIAASLAIRWLPFRRVMALADWAGTRPTPEDTAPRVRRVRWAVERWANIAPWRAVCFQRGLAAHWMLRRRGIPSFLHYGIDGRAESGISAHVWVVLDGKPLLGGSEAARHTCVSIRPQAPAEAH